MSTELFDASREDEFWRLGKAFDLGTWDDDPGDSDLAHRTLLASSALLSRVLDLDKETASSLVEFTWRFVPEQHASPRTFRATVTGHATVAGGQETVSFHLAMADEKGEIGLEGECTLRVKGVTGKGDEGVGAPPARFANETWVTFLINRLREDSKFAESTNFFDGSIGVRFGSATLGLRIYRGKIVDTGRAVFGNATFSIAAPSHTWLEYARRPRNEFISFAMADRFSVSGSTYEYLRMTKAIMVLTEHVRELIRLELQET